MSEKITKESIIKSFLESSFYKSAGETSLSDVASILGIKKASLYNHIKSRAEMVDITLDYCANYIAGLTFIPTEIEKVAQNYPAETVFKGIVSRYIKMHEKNPLFLIYTFIESQKYFDNRIAKIITARHEKLVSQTKTVLIALVRHGKISLKAEQLETVAEWLVSGILNLLSDRLLVLKQIVVTNPKSGDGELFKLQGDDSEIDKITDLVSQFSRLLN